MNLQDKTVFLNKTWNQSLNVHLVGYKGWSKLYGMRKHFGQYISLCDHPLSILVNE